MQTDITLSIPESVIRFATLHPRDDTEVSEKLAAVLCTLVDATRETAAA